MLGCQRGVRVSYVSIQEHFRSTVAQPLNSNEKKGCYQRVAIWPASMKSRAVGSTTERTWQGGGPWQRLATRRHNPSDLSGLPRWGPSLSLDLYFPISSILSEGSYCAQTFLNVDGSPPSQMPQSTTSHLASSSMHLARLYRLRSLLRIRKQSPRLLR